MKKRYLVFFILSLTIFLVLRFPYREFIYSEGVFDFYIADTSPNFMTIFLYVFFYKWKKGDQYPTLYLILVALGAAIIYETILQPLISVQTFDKRDIFASVLGSIICIFICLKVENKKYIDLLNFKIPR